VGRGSVPGRRRFLVLGMLLASSLAGPQPLENQTLDVSEAGIRELQLEMAAGRLSAVALVDAYLARIAAYDDQGPELNALLQINPRVREQALALDEERRQTGPRSPLHGIPVILKDNYSTVDMPTTGASRALAGFVPNGNATQVQKLLDAGALILAKANLHEFAYGITTISSLGGQTRNPYDPARIPGGSSGGTAAAVAAGFATVGMGSDTCGSIRIPAAFNNLVGLRPTKGLSSIHGIMPLSTTQDVAGPLARSIEDLAIVLDIVTGYDSQDAATSVMLDREAPKFRDNLGNTTLRGVRIGRLGNYFDPATEEVREVLDDALNLMASLGAEIVDVNLAQMSELIGRSGVIGHEFETDLNAYLAEFGSTAYTSLEAIVASGQHHEAVDGVLSRSAAATQDPVAYQAALAARQELRAAIQLAMMEQDLHFLAYPPAGAAPVLIGENQPGNNCSLSANSGLPALSVPAGFTSAGLPIGMELLGAEFSDAQLLALGHAFEQVAQYRRSPPTTPPLVQ